MCRRFPPCSPLPPSFSRPSPFHFHCDFLRCCSSHECAGCLASPSHPNHVDESLFRDVRLLPSYSETSAGETEGRRKTRHRERQINLRRRAGYAWYYINEYISRRRYSQVVTTRHKVSSALGGFTVARGGSTRRTTRRLRRCTCTSRLQLVTYVVLFPLALITRACETAVYLYSQRESSPY